MLRASRVKPVVAVALAALVVGTSSAGCSLFSSPPEPGDAARALAGGLSTGNLGAVEFANTTPAKATAFVAKAYKGLGTLRPQVSLSKLSHNEGSDHATATLSTRWDVSASPTDWTYETKVDMALVDDRWKVTWSPDVVAPDLAPDESLAITRKWPRRADIVDSAGGKIMTEREVAVVGIDKTKVSGAQATASARTLAELLGIDAGRFAAKVGAAGAKAFVQGLTVRATDPLLTKNGPAIQKIKGALTVPAMQVLGPSRTWAAPILGSVGEATAEQVAKSKGTLEAGDMVGVSGLQYRYDAQLRGTPGLAVLAVKRGADGSVLDKRELFAELSKEGEPLRLSLDQKAQSAAEAALAGQTARPTALVAVRVSTGEVLAAAVGPGAAGAPLALAGKEAPGSTFKIASSLALVRKGATAATKLPCTDTLTVDGRQFGNYTGYPQDKLGDIPMQTALAFSCNTAFISQHTKVSQDDLAQAAQSLGMGEKLDLPFTGFLGSVPATDNEVEHAASFIG
ncbi:MAG TPA: penicillin-binding transpeptidase domain-containing protein, partial [Terrabacter sp.]|nr:penicillin-binding transpeptidase domain-containing protein [Terrabacter sp.]